MIIIINAESLRSMAAVPYTTQIMLSAEEPVKFKLNIVWTWLNTSFQLKTLGNEATAR